jgi:hypothetical protein
MPAQTQNVESFDRAEVQTVSTISSTDVPVRLA